MAQRGNLELTDPRLAQIDLTYHDINPNRGLFHVLERRGLASSIVTKDAIERAKTQPPMTTRAALRGRFLAMARATDTSVTVDWMRLKINGENAQEVLLGDPFAAVDERVDRMIQDMQAG